MISGGYLNSVQTFVKALERYSPSLEGLKALSKAAADVGVPELSSASIRLQGLVKTEGAIGVNRFASKAPTKIYPTREEVLGNLLGTLSTSKNASVQAIAAELAAGWFQSVATSIVGIYGKRA